MISLLRMAMRNVVRNRRRSLITFSALFVALSVMVTIRGCVNGMVATIRESVALGQTGAIQIHRKGYLAATGGSSFDLDVPADDAFLAQIAAVPGVRAVTARISFGAMANANDTTSAALFTAIDPIREVQVCPRRSDMITSGKSLAASMEQAVGILAPELATTLGIRLGDHATLLVSDKDGAMNALDLDFIGAYGQAGVPLPDKKIGFVPLPFAQELLRMQGRATEIAVAVDRLADADVVKVSLQAVVGPAYEVSTWHDVSPWVDDAVASYHQILGLLSTIFLVVALLGVVNTMLMSVFERTREIGTMLALGVRRRQIVSLFLLEAALLGISGGVGGALAGGGLILWFARNGIKLQIGGLALPVYIFPSIAAVQIASMLVLATLGAVVAALWPALRASRLRPVQALASV